MPEKLPGCRWKDYRGVPQRKPRHRWGRILSPSESGRTDGRGSKKCTDCGHVVWLSVWETARAIWR